MTVRKDYIVENQVLGIVENKVALPGLITDTGVTADTTGRKIIF